jgi:hypothetical protein
MSIEIDKFLLLRFARKGAGADYWSAKIFPPAAALSCASFSDYSELSIATRA